MKKRNILISITGIAVAVALVSSWPATEDLSLVKVEGETAQETVAEVSPSSNFEFVEESKYPISIGMGSFETYGTVEELNQSSVLVAEVKIKDQETVYLRENPPLVETWSEAEIKEVLKGDENLKTITIAEMGGVMDMSKSKGNEMRSTGPVESVPFIESTVEGSPVMKKGNTYVVFLRRGLADRYAITGTVQGKIRVDDASNKGVVTIKPDHFTEHMNDYFWFQRKFAGKGGVEIKNALKNTIKNASK